MARRKKISADVLRRVPGFVEQGLTASNIADAIGCTVGTLRVKCSQMGISLRQMNRGSAAAPGHRLSGHAGALQASTASTSSSIGTVKSAARSSPASLLSAPCAQRPGIVSNARPAMITLLLPETIFVQFREQAALRGLSAGTYASMLLEIVVRDCLYDAVLDGQ